MLKTLANVIPCLPSEERIMGSASMHSAICARSRAEVHVSREMLLPSTFYVFAFAENCAVGTVHLEVGHLSTSEETKKVFLKAHSGGFRQPCWSYLAELV